MFRTINNKRLRTLVHICFSFLSVLLCVLLIFNAGFIDCFAVAGVDDAALLFLLAAICGACGVSFATYESAEAGTSALYNNMDSGTRTILDGYVEKLEAELAVNTVGAYVAASFVADYWSDVLKAVVATFGTYEAINTVTNLSDPNFTGVTESTAFEYSVNCNKSSVTQYQINNMTHTIIGYEATGFTVPSHVDVSAGQSTRRYTEYFSIANGVFDCFFIEYGGDTFDGTESIRYSNGRLAYGSTLHYFSDTLYFGGSKLVKELIDSGDGFALTANGINIVQSGYIMGTDIPVSTGICPDGIWTEKTFNDWLNDLIFGNTLPGNPGIDAGAYPGNDVWHDGSINDDIAVGSPSIGIAVPTTGEDAISLNPDIARDYDATDTKIGDIAGDTTGDSTGDGTADSKPDSTPSNTLPLLSLPEILFKEKFPFCLPWDIYVLFSSLKAEPEAPKFVIPFEIERFGVDEEIVIDFADFEEPVKVLRFFISVVFVIGLILTSRRLIGA